MAQTALRRGSQEDGNSEYFTGCPIGGGFIWYGLPDKIPSNCRICNNSTLAISSFAKLYENLDGAWGESGANMNLPDLRGRFPRGVDGTAGNDPDKATRAAANAGGNSGDAVGSMQDDAFKSHTHRSWKSQAGGDANFQAIFPSRGYGGDDNVPIWDNSGLIENTGSSESRPKNANVYFVIRVE
jgi:hypothetical protein